MLGLVVMLSLTARAFADVTYHSYNALREWNLPGGYTTAAFTMTALTAASIWFVGRAIWLNDRAARKRSWMFAALTFVPALLVALMFTLKP